MDYEILDSNEIGFFSVTTTSDNYNDIMSELNNKDLENETIVEHFQGPFNIIIISENKYLGMLSGNENDILEISTVKLEKEDIKKRKINGKEYLILRSGIDQIVILNEEFKIKRIPVATFQGYKFMKFDHNDWFFIKRQKDSVDFEMEEDNEASLIKTLNHPDITTAIHLL